jgi:hypothetical protein
MLHSLKNKELTFAQAMASKVIDPQKIEAVVEALRTQGKTIATLNGSFDYKQTF